MNKPNLAQSLSSINRRSALFSGLTALAGSALQGCGGAEAAEAAETQSAALYPQIADTSAATPELVSFFQSYFTAKSMHDVDGTMAHFSPDLVSYIDATLGWDSAGFNIIKAAFQTNMPKWPASGLSYPTRILGDMTSAVVMFTDTPELFGGELRILGSIDFKDGKYWRLVDTWDGRGWDNTRGFVKSQLSNYREGAVGERASSVIRDVTARLSIALAAGNVATAATMFSSDAVFEDMALRSQTQGRLAIQRFFTRALGSVPYGVGSQHRHTVGSSKGGGYEWYSNPAAPAKTGATALVLDANGLITRATAVYDGARYSLSNLMAMSQLTLDA